MRVCHRGASFGYKSHQNSIHGGAEILVPWPDYAQLLSQTGVVNNNVHVASSWCRRCGGFLWPLKAERSKAASAADEFWSGRIQLALQTSVGCSLFALLFWLDAWSTGTQEHPQWQLVYNECLGGLASQPALFIAGQTYIVCSQNA